MQRRKERKSQAQVAALVKSIKTFKINNVNLTITLKKK